MTSELPSTLLLFVLITSCAPSTHQQGQVAGRTPQIGEARWSYASGGAALLDDLDGGGHSELAILCGDAVLIYAGETGTLTRKIDCSERGAVVHVSAHGDGSLFVITRDGSRGHVADNDTITWRAPPTSLAALKHHELTALAWADLLALDSLLGVERAATTDQAQGPWLTLADLDGDGTVEPIADTIDGVRVLRATPRDGTSRYLPAGPRLATGRALSSPGDLDGDGAHDVVVATTNVSWSEGLHEPSGGHVVAVSGRTQEQLWSYPPSNTTGALASAGHGIVSPGDLDGDGVADLVTAAHVMFEGRVIALSGRDGTLLWVAATGGFPESGRRVASGGDWDGDGIADLVTTAFSKHMVGSGQVHLVSGRDGALLGLIPGT